MNKKFKETVETAFQDVHLTPASVRIMQGEVKMKKKMTFAAVVVCVCLALAMGALAATGAFDTLWAVWEDSFARMGTEGLFDAEEDFDLEAFEEDYGGIKEDLVISTVPGEDDLPYEQAYEIARSEILNRFGTPAEELDAMGVYPRFMREVYTDVPAEWEFYFTPRTNVDIDEDHAYDAPGEYRVFLLSPSGEVTFSNWYNDDFWPQYAQRSWDAGKCDYVYAQASFGNGFWLQSQQDQAHFIALFQEMGYDTSILMKTDEELLAMLDIALMFAETSENLMNADNACVAAALTALEAEYGLNADMLDACCYGAVLSPVVSETVDVCFAFNYNVESERIGTGAIGSFECFAVNYANRLGMYEVCVRPDTLEAVKIVFVPYSEEDETADSDLLLYRKNWTAEDLTAYQKMLDALRAIDAQTDLTWEEGRQAACQVLLSFGGDPAIYGE